MAIAGKIDREQVLRDVAAAIEVAKEGGKVAIVGFCLGGTVAWGAAGRLSGLSAAVGYYGGGIIGLKDLKPRVPTAAAFRREGPAHSRRRRERGRRRPSGRRGPHLSRRSRLQLRPAGELRRAERRARLDAHDRVSAQASGVGGGAPAEHLERGGAQSAPGAILRKHSLPTRPARGDPRPATVQPRTDQSSRRGFEVRRVA